MKKFLKVLLIIILAAAAGNAIYRFFIRKSVPEGPANEQVLAILQQNDCFVCHSKTPQLPFYVNFPVIGDKMNEHTIHAVRAFDLDGALTNPEKVNEADLAKLEYALTYNTMPILEYKAIHWGTSFTDREKSILADWISAQRNGAPAITPLPDAISYDEAKAQLGEKMYNDKRISLDGTISCASCHILKDGGADESSDRTSEGINGQFGGVNAPTVYNAFFNLQQFWNGRAADLQEQAAGPPVNPVEMGDQTWNQIVARLSKDKALVKEFETLYPGEGLTQATVTGAIAEFEKKLITPGCPFDEYLKGNSEALSAEELEGWKVFEKNACATCHTGVILGGKSFEQLGIYEDYFAQRDPSIAYNADDDGLKGFTLKDEDLHKFKVPTLRNVALTAPYFHDGSLGTMEEAVKAMAKYELGKELSDADVNSIVTFMKTLTGKNAYLQ